MKRVSCGRNIKLPKLKMKSKLILYIITIIVSIISIIEAMYHYLFFAIDVCIFVFAAIIFCSSCWYLIHDFLHKIKGKVELFMQKNFFTYQLYQDYYYRTVFGTLFSFVINIFYAISNGICGILNHSLWLQIFSIYYIFLSSMKFSIVWYEKRLSKSRKNKSLQEKQWRIYGICGIILILTTIALSKAVVLLIQEEGGKYYSGTLIFAVAAYTFYKIISSIINRKKAAKMNSILLIAIRNIGYVDALVAVLSLQTAMFSSFGGKDEKNINIMNGITGSIICVMVLFIGINMSYLAKKNIKKYNETVI